MIREQLNALLGATKNEIVHLLTEKYLADNDGLYPNWEDDEEIVVDGSDFRTFRISIDMDNTYDDTRLCEKQEINEYRVTNDGNLFFVCGDYDNEIEWTEVATDELVAIYYNLLKGFSPTPMKKESFPCLTLSRGDFEERHFITRDISNEQMALIAKRVGDMLTVQHYWDCIETLGESEQMPRM